MRWFAVFLTFCLVAISGAEPDDAPEGFTFLGSIATEGKGRGGIGVKNILNYYLSANVATWQSAYNLCEAGAGNLLGGRLLTIRNPTEFKEVGDFLLGTAPIPVWTAAVGAGTDFVWATMQPMTVNPSFWQGGVPPASAAYDQAGYLFVGGVLDFQRYMGTVSTSPSNPSSLRFVCEAARQD